MSRANHEGTKGAKGRGPISYDACVQMPLQLTAAMNSARVSCWRAEPSNWYGIVARARRRDPAGCLRQAVSLHSARLRGSFLAAPLSRNDAVGPRPKHARRLSTMEHCGMPIGSNSITFWCADLNEFQALQEVILSGSRECGRSRKIPRKSYERSLQNGLSTCFQSERRTFE
jgi:hypothetical protein